LGEKKKTTQKKTQLRLERKKEKKYIRDSTIQKKNTLPPLNRIPGKRQDPTNEGKGHLVLLIGKKKKKRYLLTLHVEEKRDREKGKIAGNNFK